MSIAPASGRADDFPADAPGLAQAPIESESPAESIRGLLDEAEALMTERKLTSPQGDSALDRYRRVLVLDPGNPRARIGIRQIAETYLGWARDALRQGELDRASRYLDQARSVDEAVIGVDRVAKEIEAQRRRDDATVPSQPPFDPFQGHSPVPSENTESSAGALPQIPDPDRLAPVALPFIDPLISGGQGPSMMALPPGRQTIGPTASGAQAEVVLPRFAISKFEITVGEFRRFVDETGYRTSAERDGGCNYWLFGWRRQANRYWRSPGFEQDEDHPVVCVSRQDAEAFTDWLSRETGHPYGLPSEAQWEYAARASTGGANYWRPLGVPACRFANVSDLTRAREHSLVTSDDNVFRCTDDHVTTAPVGQFIENDFELHDMLGNVGEWVADCWQPDYANLADDGSTQQAGDCDYGLARGGSWYELPASVSTTFRLRLRADQAFSHIGFRVKRN